MSRVARSALLAVLGIAAALTAYLVVSQMLHRRAATPGATPGGASPPAATPTVTPTSTLAPPLPGHADPVSVAKGYVQADQSWSWQDYPDPDTAATTRADAWSTQAWAAVLAQSSSAGYLTAQRVDAHEVDTVSVDSVVQQDPSTATSKTELVLSTVTVTQDGTGPSPSTGYLQLTVLQQPNGGWAVGKAQIS